MDCGDLVLVLESCATAPTIYRPTDNPDVSKPRSILAHIATLDPADIRTVVHSIVRIVLTCDHQSSASSRQRKATHPNLTVGSVVVTVSGDRRIRLRTTACASSGLMSLMSLEHCLKSAADCCGPSCGPFFPTSAQAPSLRSRQGARSAVSVRGQLKELLPPNARFQSFCHKSEVLIISIYMV